VKLLLDENLSRRIVPMLETGFPGSSHVVLLGLERAGDHDIWIYAQQNDFVIVTRDSDFSDMNALYGPPSGTGGFQVVDQRRNVPPHQPALRAYQPDHHFSPTCLTNHRRAI
jgi:predicted nuclease of predicted toxin-antitoxin system